MNILALDLARQVGHAGWKSSEISSGTKSFKPLRGQSTAALFGKWSIWIEQVLLTNDIHHCSYELIDWDIENKAWKAIYLGMVGILRGTCHNCNIDLKAYPVKDIKLTATGKAKADKIEMVRTARLMWPDQAIIDDNQADALWLLYLTMKDLGLPVQKHQEMLF